MRRAIWGLWLLGLAACGGSVPAGRDAPYQVGERPSRPAYGTALPAGQTQYSNESLAQLFVRLTHDLEWGAERPHLVRFEDSVRVGLSGRGADQYAGFIGDYLAELRRETGIDISASSDKPNLAIRFVPGPEFRRRLPQHLCVVAPGRLDWETFRGDPVRYGTRAYETQRTLKAMTVFIPDNIAPYRLRLCLIEEIAQALGPANDFYGLGDSIFNDDAAHIWPTRLDYLMLRVLYAPGMRTGQSREETLLTARTALDRLNPHGRGAPPLKRLRPQIYDNWVRSIREALDRRRSRSARVRSAEQAVKIAGRRAPNSIFHCRSLMTALRVHKAGSDWTAALRAAEQAQPVCAAAHGPSDIRLARLALERAEVLHRGGRPEAAYRATSGLEEVFASYGQEERLVALYALQAASLRAIQRPDERTEALRKAVAWGGYALGVDHPDVRRWSEK